jgi:N-acetyl-anhydromuramyl-L-alanine amidase AmpD
VLLIGVSCGKTPEKEPGIPFKQAPCYKAADRSARDIDTVVIHTTEGSYAKDETFEANQKRIFDVTVRWFLMPRSRVSAHYIVGGDGRTMQMVKDKDIAWHATYYNGRSIGIECAGWAARKETWTPKLLEALADLVADLVSRHGIEVRHPAGDAITDGGKFKGTGIVGHNQVQTPGSLAVKEGRTAKTDPGKYFPWERFIEMVRARTK